MSIVDPQSSGPWATSPGPSQHRAPGSLVTAGRLIGRNPGPIILCLPKGLLLSGFGYYTSLFGAFGASPALSSQSLASIVISGVERVITAWWDMAQDHGVVLLPAAIGGIVAGEAIALILAHTRHGIRLADRIRLTARHLARRARQTPVWSLCALALIASYYLGGAAGGHDARTIERGRLHPFHCYIVDGKLVPAVVLARNDQTTILVEVDRTMVRASDTITGVVDCRHHS